MRQFPAPFDLLFGTFRNPHDFAAETGFYHGASARVPEMLRFRDVSQPPFDNGHAPHAATALVEKWPAQRL